MELHQELPREESSSVATPVGAPHVTVHEDTLPSCGGCALRLVEVGQFGRIDDPVLLRGLPLVERDRSGKLVAAVRSVPHELVVFERTGETANTVARPGDGPGEIREIWDMRLDGADTLWVGHGATVSLFSPNGAFHRSMRLDPVPPSQPFLRFAGFQEDGFMLAGMTRDPSGHALRVFDRSGRFVRSGGPPGLGHARDVERGMMVPARVTAPAGDGTVWFAGPEPNYRIERADLDGVVHRVIGVRSPSSWHSHLSMTPAEFMAWTEERRQNPPQPAPPTGVAISHLHVRPDSLLLVVAHVAPDDWLELRTAAAAGVTQREGPPATDAVASTLRSRDTILDVIDPSSGSVLARVRLPGLSYLSSDGTLYRPTVGEFGIVQVRAFEVVLERR